MRTIADEKLDGVKDYVTSAIEDLSEIIVDECPGSDQYTSKLSETLHEIFNLLLNIRQKLKGKGDS